MPENQVFNFNYYQLCYNYYDQSLDMTQIHKRIHHCSTNSQSTQHFCKKIPANPAGRIATNLLKTKERVGTRCVERLAQQPGRVCATIHGKAGRLLGFTTRSSSLPFSLRFRQLISPLDRVCRRIWDQGLLRYRHSVVAIMQEQICVCAHAEDLLYTQLSN